jgi:hypothetical protein
MAPGLTRALGFESFFAMKTLILTTLFFFASPTIRAYDNPPSLCYEGCTPWMQQLEQDYEQKGQAIPFDPTVYSGACHVLGASFSPDYEQHAVMMIDHKTQDSRVIEPFFSVIFSFFAGQNDFVTWNLDQARKEMSPYWHEHGNMIHADRTSRVVIPYEDGSPAYIYWMRFNPETKEAYLITYFGVYSKMLCRLQAHTN